MKIIGNNVTWQDCVSKSKKNFFENVRTHIFDEEEAKAI
jgi:hypothetical protein